jgi:hypothetical protein
MPSSDQSKHPPIYGRTCQGEREEYEQVTSAATGWKKVLQGYATDRSSSEGHVGAAPLSYAAITLFPE